MWSLTSLRMKLISSFRKFRSYPPKDFFDSIDSCTAAMRGLFDHLVGTSEQPIGTLMPSAFAVFRLMASS
jgi:hypothetical protein